MLREITFAAAAVLPACAGLAQGPHNSEPNDVGGGDTITLASDYSLTNRFSITSASLAPEPAYELLSDLDSDPGELLVKLADAAGVPAAETLFGALPSSLETRIAGWMSDAIGRDGRSEVQTLMEWSRLVLADMEVHSTLAIRQDASRPSTHTLTNFAFHVADEVIEESIPQIPSLPGAGHAEIVVTSDRRSDGLHVEFAEHRFGLLFGDAAYNAFESLVQLRYGTDVRGVLGAAVECPAVADSVASKCVLGVCVGHTSELLGLCEGALDRAQQEIYEQFSALDAEVLLLKRGEARVVATESRSTLVDGRWDAEAELGQGLRALPASFAGESF